MAEPILLDFQRMLGQHESPTSDEQEFLMAMQQTWEDARTEGGTEMRADDVLTVLRVRGIAVSDEVRRQIQAERDLARLKRWLERAIMASSIAEVIERIVELSRCSWRSWCVRPPGNPSATRTRPGPR